CEGADRGKPVLGLTLIKGMHRNGTSYEGGTIMDPRDGTLYRALMQLSPDGQQLEVRGYVGISLFGRSQTWRRLPDNALSPPAPTAAQEGVNLARSRRRRRPRCRTGRCRRWHSTQAR